VTIVHKVNLTNSMMLRGQFREFIPVGPHTVTIRGFASKLRGPHLPVFGQDVPVNSRVLL
jgi:hypothetical protein